MTRLIALVVFLAAILAIIGGGLRGEPQTCRGLAGCPGIVVEVQP